MGALLIAAAAAECSDSMPWPGVLVIVAFSVLLLAVAFCLVWNTVRE
jgi:hypothetical protein